MAGERVAEIVRAENFDDWPREARIEGAEVLRKKYKVEDAWNRAGGRHQAREATS